MKPNGSTSLWTVSPVQILALARWKHIHAKHSNKRSQILEARQDSSAIWRESKENRRAPQVSELPARSRKCAAPPLSLSFDVAAYRQPFSNVVSWMLAPR